MEQGKIMYDDDDNDDVDYGDYDEDCRIEFSDPEGISALRAETKDNPRIYPCPTCGREEVLTMLDIQLGYQCDRCADIAEGRLE